MLIPSSALSQPSSPSSPSDRKQLAQTLYEEGRAQFNLGNYQAAISDFERAYVLFPQPLFLYNLAQLAALTGDRARAVALFERYLVEDPDALERVEVETRIRALKESLRDHPQTSVPTASAKPLSVPAAPPPSKPVSQSRRTWLWGVAGTLVLGSAITLGVVFGRSEVDPTPDLGRGHLE